MIVLCVQCVHNHIADSHVDDDGSGGGKGGGGEEGGAVANDRGEEGKVVGVLCFLEIFSRN